MEYIILRPTGSFYFLIKVRSNSGVYGLNDTFAVYELMTMINQGLFFFIPSPGNKKLMFTHIDDVVEGIKLSIFYGKES